MNFGSGAVYSTYSESRALLPSSSYQPDITPVWRCNDLWRSLVELVEYGPASMATSIARDLIATSGVCHFHLTSPISGCFSWIISRVLSAFCVNSRMQSPCFSFCITIASQVVVYSMFLRSCYMFFPTMIFNMKICLVLLGRDDRDQPPYSCGLCGPWDEITIEP